METSQTETKTSKAIKHTRSNKWKIACIVFGIIAISVGIGVGLGVGLSIGLRNKDSDCHSMIVTSLQNTTTMPMTTTNTMNTSCVCGCSPINPNLLLGRVINGIPAANDSWPWMVYLDLGFSGACGGSLISYQHVLTASHCIDSLEPHEITVHAGFTKLTGISQSQTRNVTRITSHPNYNSNTFDYDIAILTLSSSYEHSRILSPICLPSSETELPILNEKALIMGWGYTIDGNPLSIPNNLQQAVVNILNTSSLCTVSDIKFCAGLGRTDTCQGDSGGPLLTNVMGMWTITGIVSSGQGCPGVGSYTRVTAFRSFINATLKSK